MIDGTYAYHGYYYYYCTQNEALETGHCHT